jgi:O-antigen ligase
MLSAAPNLRDQHMLTEACPPVFAPYGSRPSTTADPHDAVILAKVEPESGALRFYLFILVNALLHLRPSDVLPELENWPLYEVAILACLAVSFPAVLRLLRPATLIEQPINVCVLGLLVAVGLSPLTKLNFGEAYESGLVFFKIVMYYLLLLANVNSLRRLRQFLFWLLLFIFVLTVLALLQQHEVIDLPTLAAYRERQEGELDPSTGQDVILARLCSAGIYNNPNDLSRILLVGLAAGIYYLCGPHQWLLVRLFSLLCIGLFGYAFYLTHSRGGFLGLLAGVLVLLPAGLGWRRSILLAGIVLPILLVMFGGRQTNISTSEGTGQQRLQIWYAGFQHLVDSPIFGVGMDHYGDQIVPQYVAHNSFVHSYVELGLFGGTLFFGGFYLALWGLHRLAPQARTADPGLAQVRPFLMALIAAYVIGMFSTSRTYVPPTYMILGLAAVYLQLAFAACPALRLRLSPRLVTHVTIASACTFLGTYLFVRAFIS